MKVRPAILQLFHACKGVDGLGELAGAAWWRRQRGWSSGVSSSRGSGFRPAHNNVFLSSRAVGRLSCPKAGTGESAVCIGSWHVENAIIANPYLLRWREVLLACPLRISEQLNLPLKWSHCRTECLCGRLHLRKKINFRGLTYIEIVPM
jgi:hypothetical protein